MRTGSRSSVDGRRHRAAAFGMPRPDAGRGRALWSGFWATVPVEPRAVPGEINLRLKAVAGGRGRARRTTGDHRCGRAGAARSVRRNAGARRVRADGRLHGHVRARRGSSAPRWTRSARRRDGRWVCLISDDCSAPERFARHRGRDRATTRRFTLSRSPERLGFYRNFERALGLVPAEAELIALCDQDDRWHPDKLDVLRGALGDAMLAYSDQRLVTPDGRLLRETMWEGRRNNHTNLASMLIANTITGAASLFRRELAELALPFPVMPGLPVPRPLARRPRARRGRRGLRRPPAVRLRPARRGRASATWEGERRRRRRPAHRGSSTAGARYFFGYLAREVQAQAALARCASRLTRREAARPRAATCAARIARRRRSRGSRARPAAGADRAHRDAGQRGRARPRHPVATARRGAARALRGGARRRPGRWLSAARELQPAAPAPLAGRV